MVEVRKTTIYEWTCPIDGWTFADENPVRVKVRAELHVKTKHPDVPITVEIRAV